MAWWKRCELSFRLVFLFVFRTRHSAASSARRERKAIESEGRHTLDYCDSFPPGIGLFAWFCYFVEREEKSSETNAVAIRRHRDESLLVLCSRDGGRESSGRTYVVYE